MMAFIEFIEYCLKIIEHYSKISYESYFVKCLFAAISFYFAWKTLRVNIKNVELQILKSEQEVFDKIETSIRKHKELGLKIIDEEQKKQDTDSLKEEQISLEEDLINMLEFICFNVNRKRISKKYFIEMHYDLLDYAKDNIKAIKENDGTSVYIEIRKLLYKNSKKINKLKNTQKKYFKKN